MTGVWIVFSTICSGADVRKHQSPASLTFVSGIHRWPVNSPHKGPVTRKMFPFSEDVMFLEQRGPCNPYKPCNHNRYIEIFLRTDKLRKATWKSIILKNKSKFWRTSLKVRSHMRGRTRAEAGGKLAWTQIITCVHTSCAVAERRRSGSKIRSVRNELRNYIISYSI